MPSLKTRIFGSRDGALRRTARTLRMQLKRRKPARHWAAERAEDLATQLRDLDAGLWAESAAFAAKLEQDGARILEASPVVQGGGGAYALLYFLTRQARPEVAVETGVASGWSSTAILAAMEANGVGRLHSSDLPYADRDGSAAAIGILVPDALRPRWRLCTQGDRVCLPEIVADCARIDLFHYDSDKKATGRDFAWGLVKPRLAPGAVVIFDDIQDNFHFRDLVAREGVPFQVFEFADKFIGLIRMP
jgi:predicted O-methyltransferase YrrM